PAGDRNVRFAFANDDGRLLAIIGNVDPINTRSRELDLRVRRVDARRVALLERAQRDDDATLRDEQRDLVLVESRYVHVRVAGDPQLADAEIDFRTTFAGQPHVVAVRDRIVELDRRPFGRAILRREKELAADIRNAPDTARRLVLVLRDLI